MRKQFMIDIESTGVSFDDDCILEIGILEMDFVDGFWRGGREFQTYLRYLGVPESEFAKKHLVEVYKAANYAPIRRSDEIRNSILNFFKSCGKVGHEVLLCGWNASNFDIPMLHAKGYLNPPGYETGPDGKDTKVGDHHYRIYEIGGAVQLTCDTLGLDYDYVCKTAKDAWTTVAPKGKEHDALFDCYKQLAILNGLIKMVRK